MQTQQNHVLARLGITQELKPTFDSLEARTLVLDADGLIYEACHKAAKLETAIRRAKLRILEVQFLTKCQFVRAHLTARGSHKAGRHLLVGAKGAYQGNREGSVKPPLLEPLREALAKPGVFDEDDGITVILHRHLEADDGMMQDAYTIPGAVVYSADKDLRIVPCDWYDPATGKVDRIKDRYGWARYSEEAGKLLGHGTAFFWGQMLTGDEADHVRGLRYVERLGPYRALKMAAKDCPVCAGTGYLPPHTRGSQKCECLRELLKEPMGHVGAGEVLAPCRTEDDAANAVLGLYRAIGQNPLPEACMLWLLRANEDTAEGYIWSLGLSPENRAFVQECYNTPYRKEVAYEDEVPGGA